MGCIHKLNIYVLDSVFVGDNDYYFVSTCTEIACLILYVSSVFVN